MIAVFLASEECPVACFEVIFVKCIASSRVFAYCATCGGAWFEPEQSTGEFVTARSNLKFEYLVPEGITFATRLEIEAAGLSQFIIGEVDDRKWISTPEEETAWLTRGTRHIKSPPRPS